jgi:hypothetical protein
VSEREHDRSLIPGVMIPNIDNLAANGENHTLISNEYLEALAMRR